MRCIPAIISEDYYDLFIILREDNLTQIKRYDPAEVTTLSLPIECLSRKVNNIVIMYATDTDLKLVEALCERGNVQGALRHLSRGFTWRPNKGDGSAGE